MNTDLEHFSPKTELEEYKNRDLNRGRPFIFFILFMLAVILWAVLLAGYHAPASDGGGNGKSGNMSAGESSGSGGGNGSGGTNHGNGSGSGDTGDGSAQSFTPGLEPDNSNTTKTDEDDQTQANSPSSSQTTSQEDNSKSSAEVNYSEKTPQTATTATILPTTDKVPDNQADENDTPLDSPETPPDKSGKIPPNARGFAVSPSINLPSASTTGNGKSGDSGFYGAGAPSGNKVLFLVDVSSSMSHRIAQLQTQLRKAVFNADKPNQQSYSRNGGFIIITYSNSTRIFPSNGLCRYRNKGSMRSAAEFITRLTPGGGTMMINAWEIALQATYRNNIDTIYFLSDGSPGDDFSAEWLLETIKKRSGRKPTIHCISLGNQNDMMKNIAEACNGTYVSLP